MMNKTLVETIGVRYMGRAALHKDPLEDHVEYTCPLCGLQGIKNARRAPADYHFVDGFVQDLRGEATTCRGCKRSLRVSPVIMLHDPDEKRRFEAVFLPDLDVSRN